MKIELKLVNLDTIDCTADPHYIYSDDIKLLLKIVYKLCQSSIVQKIEYVEVIFEYKGGKEKRWYSDNYAEVPLRKGDKPASGPFAKKYKVEGLYFWSDNEGADRKLPIGLDGVKFAIKGILRSIDHIDELFNKGLEYFILHIDVIYEAFGTGGCSDYIELDILNKTLNISTMDWYIGTPEYYEFIDQLNEFLDEFGMKGEIEPSEPPG